jgi:hypothetical protein
MIKLAFKFLILVTAASLTSSCGGTSSSSSPSPSLSSSSVEPKPKPYAVTVIRQFPGFVTSCELLFTFTNKLKYADNLHIRYIAFDGQGNTINESTVYFDTTLPNRQNAKKEYIFASSSSGIPPCDAVERVVITTNGHLLEKREFVFAKRR